MLRAGGTSGDFIIFHLTLLRLFHRLLDKFCTATLPISPKQVTLNGHLLQLVDNASLSWSQWSRRPVGLSPSQHSPLDSKSSRRPVSKHACSYVATTLGRNIYRNIAKHSFPFLLRVAVCIFLDTLCISTSTPV